MKCGNGNGVYLPKLPYSRKSWLIKKHEEADLFKVM